MTDITSQNLTELIKNIKDKKISSEEVTKSFIERAEKSKKLNCYITENFEDAINKAKKFDKKPDFDCKFDFTAIFSNLIIEFLRYVLHFVIVYHFTNFNLILTTTFNSLSYYTQEL